MIKTLQRVSAAVLLNSAISLSPASVMDIRWDELPPLPPSPGQTRQAGLAGPFAGVHGDALLVGGGANFPDRAPWEGGAKVWWDHLFVLERQADGKPGWVTDRHFKLPRPIAYGMSFSTPDGVVCAGGCDATQCYRDVFLLSWNPRTRDVATTTLPPLPEPLAFMAGAMVGRTLYLIGGQQAMKDAAPSRVFWSLDLSRRDHPEEFNWKVLPAWPGPARIVPVAAGQSQGRGGKVFVFGGRAFHAGKASDVFTDAYAFDLTTRSWQMLAPVNHGAAGGPWSVMAGTSVTVGDEILIVSGDRGDVFLQLEKLDLEVDALRRKGSAATPAEQEAVKSEIESRLRAKKDIYERHAGFGREVLGYDPQRDAWRVVARSPVPGQVTSIAVPWGNAIVIPSGEIRPGIRTPAVTRLVPVLR